MVQDAEKTSEHEGRFATTSTWTGGTDTSLTTATWTGPRHLPVLSAEVLAVVESPNLEGFGVLDTGATESVASLESLEHIAQRRRKNLGGEYPIKVIPGPCKNFRFGNGSTQMSESFVLLSQRLGGYSISLGLYTIDATGVPLLIGIRTLERLGAVIDCSRGAMVLKGIDDSLVVALKRSAAGHLLLDLCCADLLTGGARILYNEVCDGSEKKDNDNDAAAFALFPAIQEQGPPQEDPEEIVFASELDVSHALSSEEWQQLAGVPEDQAGVWLADIFSVRVMRWETDSLDPEATTPQGDQCIYVP